MRRRIFLRLASAAAATALLPFSPPARLVDRDFAVGAHIDLYTASRLLGRVREENRAVLARYGIYF